LRSGECPFISWSYLVHESDWQRWGSRGGRETVRRYGNSWMALLALKRWGRITSAELEAARVLR
jgi:hypothetical protein